MYPSLLTCWQCTSTFSPFDRRSLICRTTPSKYGFSTSASAESAIATLNLDGPPPRWIPPFEMLSSYEIVCRLGVGSGDMPHGLSCTSTMARMELDERMSGSTEAIHEPRYREPDVLRDDDDEMGAGGRISCIGVHIDAQTSGVMESARIILAEYFGVWRLAYAGSVWISLSDETRGCVPYVVRRQIGRIGDAFRRRVGKNETVRWVCGAGLG